MTHTYIKKEWLVLCEDVFQNMNNKRYCHGSSYGGHHAGDRTAQKVLQSGFYWPTVTTRKNPLLDNCLLFFFFTLS
jgi:hypothetical protein